MRDLFVLAVAGLLLGACGTDDGSDSEGGTATGTETGSGECADDPGQAGCPCSGAGECAQGLTCTDDVCVAGCDEGVDLMTDIDNCGECGRACPDADGSCQAGECYGEAAYADCFSPGGDVSCDDQCQTLGAAFSCTESCANGGWAGYDVPGCSDALAQTGTCADLISNPFASAQCCCAEKLD